MLRYAEVLKRKRETAGLTLRQMAVVVDRSPTLVNDFELGRKSNPPEPDVMLKLEAALNWPVADQLTAWGYQVTPPDAPQDPEDVRETMALLRRIEWTPDRLLSPAPCIMHRAISAPHD